MCKCAHARLRMYGWAGLVLRVRGEEDRRAPDNGDRVLMGKHTQGPSVDQGLRAGQ